MTLCKEQTITTCIGFACADVSLTQCLPRGLHLMVYAPLMEIYLIRHEVSLSRSLSADRPVQRKRQSDPRQTPHGDLLHWEGNFRTATAVGNSAQILAKRIVHVILNPSDVTSIYPGQSERNEEQ